MLFPFLDRSMLSIKEMDFLHYYYVLQLPKDKIKRLLYVKDAMYYRMKTRVCWLVRDAYVRHKALVPQLDKMKTVLYPMTNKNEEETQKTKKEMLDELKAIGVIVHHFTGDEKVKEIYMSKIG